MIPQILRELLDVADYLLACEVRQHGCAKKPASEQCKDCTHIGEFRRKIAAYFGMKKWRIWWEDNPL